MYSCISYFNMSFFLSSFLPSFRPSFRTFFLSFFLSLFISVFRSFFLSFFLCFCLSFFLSALASPLCAYYEHIRIAFFRFLGSSTVLAQDRFFSDSVSLHLTSKTHKVTMMMFIHSFAPDFKAALRAAGLMIKGAARD